MLLHYEEFPKQHFLLFCLVYAYIYDSKLYFQPKKGTNAKAIIANYALLNLKTFIIKQMHVCHDMGLYLNKV